LLFALANTTNASTNQTRKIESRSKIKSMVTKPSHVSKIHGRTAKKEKIVKLSNPFQDYCTLTMPLSVDQPRPRRDVLKETLRGHFASVISTHAVLSSHLISSYLTGQQLHVGCVYFLKKKILCKQKIPVTSNLRYMHEVLNIDEIKN
jgi:hypothetical protein